MTILTFLILSLSVYRITHLLVIDMIFEPVRKYFVVRNFHTTIERPYPTYELQGGFIRRFIGKVLICYWCTGIWVSAVTVIAFYRPFELTTSIPLIFALAAVQSLVETVWAKSVGYPLEMSEVKKDVRG